MTVDMKTCTKCGEAKPLTEFGRRARSLDGLRYDCKECQRAQTRAWGKSNPEKKSMAGRAWYEQNREAHRERGKTWRKANHKKAVSIQTAYNKRRIKNNPAVAMVARQRARIGQALRKTNMSKPGRTLEILGCSAVEYKDYLESRFLPGMNWENRREWHIDHIRPLASFDMLDTSQVRQAFHYLNTQPLWAMENFKKSARWQPEQEAA